MIMTHDGEKGTTFKEKATLSEGERHSMFLKVNNILDVQSNAGRTIAIFPPIGDEVPASFYNKPTSYLVLAAQKL